ncbi:MAG: hypothetical protein L0H26_06045 [Microlunatus sp.]|nr:hypothetical protein [Microlunatus sp.]
MALLTDEFTAEIQPQMLTELGWRSVWLHRALTDIGSDVLAPRDREVLVLVATSPYGVAPASAVAHLRRFGSSRVTAQSCLERLMTAGYLSQTEAGAIDLPSADLAWIRARVGTTDRGSP